MIRLKNLLFESRTNPIGEEEAERFLEKVGEGVEDIPEVYRGTSGDEQLGWIEPYNFKRTSENTNNYYTLIIDNSSRWSEYPERSRSIVCSTDKSKADRYVPFEGGTVYRVVSDPSAKFGVCPQEDIFYSFPKLLKKFGFTSMNQFNLTLSSLYDLTVGGSKEIPENDWENFKREINKIGESETFEKIYNHTMERGFEHRYPDSEVSNFYEFANLFFPNYNSMIEMLEDLMDPKDNGFEVKTFKELGNLSEKEVWTSSSSLLIDVNYRDLIRKINYGYY